MLNSIVAALMLFSVQQQTPQAITAATPETQTAKVDDGIAPYAESSDPKHAADLKRDADEGKKYAEQVEKESKASKNKEWQDRAARIGKMIANIANHNNVVCTWGDKRLNPFHYTYKVLQGDEINAFSIPGGHIYIYDGLMKFVESDDELAGVLAHETAHAAFRHVATLEHRSDKDMLVTLPLIIASILAHSPEGVQVTQAYEQMRMSGWSVEAEKAADYGGFQYMERSPYNPVAMLTFMERLAQKERFATPMLRNLGIYQTHPLSRDRADSMVQNLSRAGIPIQRSKASPSFRVTIKDGSDGIVNAYFGGRKIYTFAGNEARERAEEAQARLNDFYDQVPALYDVLSDDHELLYKGKLLLSINQADADFMHLTPDALTKKTLNTVKQTLFNLGYRVWDWAG